MTQDAVKPIGMTFRPLSQACGNAQIEPSGAVYNRRRAGPEALIVAEAGHRCRKPSTEIVFGCLRPTQQVWLQASMHDAKAVFAAAKLL